MPLTRPFEIKLLTTDTSTFSDIADITAITNEAYMFSEGDFWHQNFDYQRTSFDEISGFIKKKELLAAVSEDTVAGILHKYPLSKDTFGFGMLTVSPEYRKNHIGTMLINEAEKLAIIKNYKKMQLELLKPVHYKHPDKEFLTKWYKKLGYNHISTVPYTRLYPHRAHYLKIPCNFEIYEKKLVK